MWPRIIYAHRLLAWELSDHLNKDGKTPKNILREYKDGRTSIRGDAWGAPE